MLNAVIYTVTVSVLQLNIEIMDIECAYFYLFSVKVLFLQNSGLGKAYSLVQFPDERISRGQRLLIKRQDASSVNIILGTMPN